MRAVLAAASVLLLAPGALADHPLGPPVYADEVGPYEIVASASMSTSGEEAFVEYGVNVRDARTSERVQDARVVATAITPDGERGPLELGGIGDAWLIVIPLDQASRIDWTMAVRVTSSLGEASFEHPLRLEGGGVGSDGGGEADGATTLPVVGGITAAVLLAVALLVRRSRQGATGG